MNLKFRTGLCDDLVLLLSSLEKLIVMSPDTARILTRPMTPEDIPAVIALQSRIYPEELVWSPEELQSHLAIFSEGQTVAVDDTGKVMGSSSTLIIDWDDYAESAKWPVITGQGTFRTHNPLGKTLYGADMCVDPEARRHGIGTLFYEARKKLVRERGLKRMLTGGRIPGYAKVSEKMTAQEYVAEVVRGRIKDSTLSFQLANGLVVLDVVPEYLEDAESRGFATLLEWLNPEYVTNVSLHVAEEPAALVESAELAGAGQPRISRVRIAAMQYLLRPITRFEDFATQVEFFCRSAQEYGTHFVLFPEYFTTQLLSYLRERAPGRAVRRLAELAPEYEALFKRISEETGMYIIAGTHPIIQQGELFNAAHLFTPNGMVFRQKKVHLTQTEKGPYQMSRGHGFYVYHTEFGKIAVLVCYDVEFPEAARVLAEAGAQIIFVPSCTDERQGFCRVRYCAQARASENQVYVAMACTVGNLPEVPGMATHYGQAAILTPSDYFFARDGIAAEGAVNQEQMVISDVDLALLEEQRVNGTVLPLNDMIKDAYDRVIHYAAPRTPSKQPSIAAEIDEKNSGSGKN
ncbi:MAG TPA: bifunctional GNAT family N-acetyltransferase/carbon-nitrogen hydrolase family protein [Candidatus Acidoferrum sp.]|nr:bifunctional GNAT family N-acetyltransferase/carbon-nitrogen hydrolase family protein [Candidatus Acidoferrum sp.]